VLAALGILGLLVMTGLPSIRGQGSHRVPVFGAALPPPGHRIGHHAQEGELAPPAAACLTPPVVAARHPWVALRESLTAKFDTGVALTAHNALVNGMSVMKEPESGLLYLVHNNELPYFDGDRAQRRLADNVFSAACADGGEGELNNLVVDVGGLYGDYGMHAASHGCRVAMFEPQLAYTAVINAAVALNAMQNRIHVIPGAVSVIDGSLLYYSAGAHNGNTYFTPNATTPDSYPVLSYRMDTLFADVPSVLYMKVDVEGFDVAVVRSADALLRAGRLKHLHLEFTVWFNGPGQGQWREVLTYLHAMPIQPRMYALHRTGQDCYGPLRENQFDEFVETHAGNHLQTDLYVTFDAGFDPKCNGEWSRNHFA